MTGPDETLATVPPPGEESYRSAVEHSIDGILLGVPGGPILSANPAALRILGMSQDEIRRTSRGDLTEGSDPRWAAALEERRRSGRVRAVLPMRRGDGTAFEADITWVAFSDASGAPRSCIIFRDVTEEVRLRDRLQAEYDITSALLAGQESSEVLRAIAHHARHLVRGTDAIILTAGALPGVLVVAAADGPRVSRLLGRKYPPGSFASDVLAARHGVLLPDLALRHDEVAEELGLGPGLLVPIVSREQAFGLIGVTTRPDRPPFGREDLDLVERLANSAGLALAYRAAQESSGTTAVLTEKSRIAADLHDRVVQHIFGVGLRLHALADQCEPPFATQLERAVDELDATVAEVRAAIFDLEWTDGGTSLGDGVRRLASEAGELLGFAPTVTVGEAARVGSNVVGQLLAVLGEALANVVRHARATSVRVGVSLRGRELVLTVRDDGVGPPPPEQRSGRGVGEMAMRAGALGGSFLVEAATPSGTRVEWRVPVVGP